MRRIGTSLVLVAVITVVASCTPPSGGGGIPAIPGTFVRVTAGNQPTSTGVLSADGQWAAFLSASTDLGGGPVHDADLFLWNRATNTTTRVTTNTSGRPCIPRLSADGNTLVFLSMDDLGGSPASLPAAYLYDRTTDTFTLIGESTPDTGCRFDSHELALSADGNTVLWTRNGDLLAWDRITNTTTTVLTSDGVYLTLNVSPDGSYAAFTSTATNLDSSTDPGVFVVDVATSTLWRVVSVNPFVEFPLFSSVTDDGDALVNLLTPGDQPNLIAQGVVRAWDRATQTLSTVVDDGRVNGVIGTSADGRYVAYLSYPSPLDTDPLEGDDPAFPSTGEVRLRDRLTDTVGIVGSGPVGIGDLFGGWTSADGNTVLFGSRDNVTGTDNNAGSMDLFLWQRS